MTLTDLSPSALGSLGGRSRAQAGARLAMVLLDALLLGVAAFVAVEGRSRLTVFERTDDIRDVAEAVGVWIVAGWLLTLLVVGCYQRGNIGAGTEEYRRVVVGSATAAGLVGIACYLAQFDLSRGFFVLLFVIGTPCLVLGRLAHRRVMHRLHAAGQLQSKVVIAGAPQHIDSVARVLARESWLGLEVVGALSTHPGQARTPYGVPVFGRPADVVQCVTANSVDAVVFAEGAVPSADEFRRLAWALEEHHAQMIVVPALTDISRERISVRPVAGLPLMLVDLPRAIAAGRWLKRVFDVVGATILLVLLAPVLVVAALAIKLHDQGPVVYRQTRVGRGGRHFACYKFRSMVVGADSLRPTLVRDGAGNEILFKHVQDPRVTTMGRFLRRFSVDELPQLVNVVRGDMSLVGPRPPLPSEVAAYDDDAMRRLRVRPGMTGLWQVSGRSDLSWEDTVRLDLYYVDNWSLVQDLHILARTASAVLFGRGAY